MLASSAAGRPRKACGQCKGHKVRCSGEKPVCRRCLRLRHICIYTGNNANVSEVLRTSSSSLQSTRGEIQTPPTSVSTAATSNAGRDKGQSSSASGHEAARGRWYPTAPSLSLASPSQDYYLGIPASLVSRLIEVYYSDVYNGSLLLHKRIFLEAVAAGTARPQVILSVCAIASIFHLDVKNQDYLKEHGFGTQWAEQAGKLAFQEVEHPTEDNIAAFMNLGLFWYSQGSWRRSNIHYGNAIQLALVLGLGVERVGKENFLESEIRRRRFWACYLMNCHAPQSMSVQDTSETTLKLTLPWGENDFEAGFYAGAMASLDSGQSNYGLFSELIRVMTYWRAVVNLIKSPESSISARVTELHSLDAQISEWWSKVPDCLTLTPANISETPHSILPKLLLLHTVYHQCLCALHSSIVPLFSWSASDDTWLSARNLSAQISYDHACEASALFEAFFTNSDESSAIPSFVAYAAYCGCAIQIPFMWCSEANVRAKAHANVRTNVRMIRTLAKYWKFSALLEVHFQYLYKMHANNPTPLENEPKHFAVGELKGFKTNGSHVRDSILRHNSILLRKSDGVAEPGEEANDLAIDDGNGMQSSDLAEQNFPRSSTPLRQSPPQRALLVGGHQPSVATIPNSTAIDTIDPYVLLQQSQNLDLFNPFLDPEAPYLFPEGEVPDFSQLGTSQVSLDFLDGWLLSPEEITDSIRNQIG
ncbi:hypothetical protein BKA65DRAFT_13263 [Rhexocercosporidium sp. MPI-PUGE-AT-0058]|nr:hypothetical protein BKA65DRAFT_13263 [Rhexocercosporidium sp. MPI-PUGE-AT-0058]